MISSTYTTFGGKPKIASRNLPQQKVWSKCSIVPWEARRFPPLFDAKFPWSVRSSKRAKSLIRNRRRARHELQQPQPPLVVQLADRGPEPYDAGVAVVVPRPVLGVPAPVGQVDLHGAGDHQLEFPGVENGQKAGVYDLIESLDEGLGLGGHAPFDPPFDYSIEVVLK